jgi:hypothetical protein
MTREQKTDLIIDALRNVWKQQDAEGFIPDRAHIEPILRGGCEHYLTGEFDGWQDAVALGLAFLSLAREELMVPGVIEQLRGQA